MYGVVFWRELCRENCLVHSLFLSHSVSVFMQRIQIEEIRNDEWFKKGYVPVKLADSEDVNLDDVNAVFDDQEVSKI